MISGRAALIDRRLPDCVSGASSGEARRATRSLMRSIPTGAEAKGRGVSGKRRRGKGKVGIEKGKIKRQLAFPFSPGPPLPSQGAHRSKLNHPINLCGKLKSNQTFLRSYASYQFSNSDSFHFT